MIPKGSTVARTRLPPFRGTATLDEEAPKTTGAPQNKKGESDGSSSSSEEEAEEEEAVAVRHPKLSAREEAQRQRKDNKRRLAAVEQRRKEAEEHKKLIQGALANLVSLALPHHDIIIIKCHHILLLECVPCHSSTTFLL